MARPFLPTGPAVRSVAIVLVAWMLHGMALAAAVDITVAPGIAFAWTDPGTDGILVFRLVSQPAASDPIVAVAATSRHLTISRFRVDPDAADLTLMVRADTAGVVAVSALSVRTRYAPSQRVRVGAAEVVALPEVGGPLELRRWTADTELGLYAAFALENTAATPLTVRTLRYAPEPLGRGLVLVDHGPASGFAAWKGAVLDRMAPAFAAFLAARGHAPRLPERALRPTSLAFPVRGVLAGARWRAPAAIDVLLQPGEALYAAITPAAFASYVDDLAIVAYPVVGYEASDAADCCRLQGVPAPILNVGGPAASGVR